MANLVSIQNVSISFGGEPVLDGVSLNIAKGDKICLVGRNGSGKSSFLKILDGSLEPDSGTVLRAQGLKTASLPQDVAGDISGTVGEIVGAAATGEQAAAAAASAVTRLGLDPAAWFSALSGGQRRRCLLARAIASQPDLLVLDEPTNHLDIDTIEWLEDYLENRVATFIFVTHDRAFLRRLAKKIVDLDRGKLNGWDCDYETFLRRKRQLLEDEKSYYEKLGKNIRREEAWLRRGVKARTARNEGRVNALMELRRKFAERRAEEGTGNFRIVSAGQSGARVARFRDVSFAYPGGREVLRGFSAEILRGERIALVGPNGAGKTTFIRLLTGGLAPTSGEIDLGTQLETVYFDQLRAKLDPELSVADNVSDGNETVYVAGRPRHILSYLSDFLFPPERARTPVKALSGGERGRLMLAKLFLGRCNFLVLDEPTNDLDMETLDLLEERLADFDGTIVMASHDREFIDNTATATWVFGGDGEVERIAGGYAEWRGLREKRDTEAAKDVAAAQADSKPEAKPRRPDRLSYKEKRELESLPGKIEALEKEEAELNGRLCDPEIYRKPPADIAAWQARLREIPAEIDAAMNHWAELESRA